VVTAQRLRADIERLKALRGAGRAVVPADWVEFAAAVGLTELDPWQERLLRSEAPRVLMNCARQTGKSTTAGVLALHQALAVPGSLVLILAPAERQAKELFSKVAEAYRALGHPVPADSYRKLGAQLANGSRIEALPGTEKTIRGFSGASLLIVDEASRVAEELGVNRDRAWPKSASWLWKRMKEIQPVLAAEGISAGRDEDNQGSQIALRRVPTSAATAATDEENGVDNGNASGSKADAAATSAATDVPAATAPATEKASVHAGYGSSGSSGSKDGPWQNDPMRHYRRGGRDAPASRDHGLGGEPLDEDAAWLRHPLNCTCEPCEKYWR
jgi:hypothetical protein